MISQRCPKCNSSRIRSGYRPTPLWSMLLLRFNLLCDSCNWEFRGFAVPGTLSSKSKRSTKKPTEPANVEKKQTVGINNESKNETSESEPVKRRKVKVRL